MKKPVALFVTAALMLAIACPAFASGDHPEAEASAAYLRDKGIMLGDENGSMNLESGLTRAEMAALLTRLHGEGQVDPKIYDWACYFEDVPQWAKPYVGYCTAMGLVNGYDSQHFGPDDPVVPAAACTVVLRACGYEREEGSEWTYDTACSYALGQGLTDSSAVEGARITRGDMAVLIYRAIRKQTEPLYAGFSSQEEAVSVGADGVIVSKTITQSDWSREDFSQQANPNIFTGFYTRGWYNALRQTVVDTDTIIKGGDEEGFNPQYTYAHTTVVYSPGDSFSTFSDIIRRVYGYYYYHVSAEPYVVNPYEFPGYITVGVSINYAKPEVLDFIQPELKSLSDKSDREKVLALNDYLCDLLEYGEGPGSAREIFSKHDAPVKTKCGGYAMAFSFLCTAADIPCITVHSENHAWNEVYVEGKWQVVDVTNNDLSYNRDAYLLCSNSSRADIMPQGTLFAKELLVPGSTVK